MRLLKWCVVATIGMFLLGRVDASPPVAETAKGFTDDWKRANGLLGNGWRSAHDDKRTWWDPVELRNAAPVNTNPDKGPIAQPNNAAGRVAAYRDFGRGYADNFTVGVWWNGKHQAVGFPIACINLENPDWGLAFCYEPQLFGGHYVLWALGRQPNQIRVVKVATGPKHADGKPMFLEMRVQGDKVKCLADGKEILESPVPKSLVGSTIHGFGLDVNPVPGRRPNVEVINGPFVLAPLKR